MLISGDRELPWFPELLSLEVKLFYLDLYYSSWCANAYAFLILHRWRMKLIAAFRKYIMGTMGQILMQPVVLLTMYRGR